MIHMNECLLGTTTAPLVVDSRFCSGCQTLGGRKTRTLGATMTELLASRRGVVDPGNARTAANRAASRDAGSTRHHSTRAMLPTWRARPSAR